MSTSWNGQWVADRLGIGLVDGRPDGSVAGSAAPGACPPLASLVGLALRHNPKRAHLVVSSVLGKHQPTDPRLVYGAGRLLGALVADALAGTHDAATGLALLSAALDNPDAADPLLDFCAGIAGPPAPRTVVLGYAETATALGHAVADQLGADYLHSTRRPVAGVAGAARFEEEHSHASSHLLLPENLNLLRQDGPLVLVDDELSTGRTALNTIAALHADHPHSRYLIAALVDLRSAADRAAAAELAQRLATSIEVVALSTGQLRLPATVLQTGTALADSLAVPDSARPADLGSVGRTPGGWPLPVRDSGRHGFTPSDRRRAENAAAEVARRIVLAMTADSARVLVLGFEELMYTPLLIALALQRQDRSRTVRYSTTTRSPVLPVDDPTYAIRTRISFASHDDPADGPGPRFAYNVDPGGDPTARFTDIVLVVDSAGDRPELFGAGGLIEQLAAVCDRVQLVTLPSYRPARRAGGERLPTALHGPEFGSYPAADVSWLLTDLSGVALEAPTEEREEAIQSGGGHYAESLPIEYQPTSEYQQLFSTALQGTAGRLAHAVGVVTELVLERRGTGAVLVSLARAGTPVGVLMRRWAAFAHGVELTHHAVSIVRGKGIDQVALQYLAAHHDPASIMFVDGWTGKGAITAELAAAVEATNRRLGTAFSPELAVLADTGGCVSIFGTREDYLIPSACLNSTVSGLVSRTVLNDELIGPNDFHGAKFYAELAGADVSLRFVEAVEAEFASVLPAVLADWPVVLKSDRTPTWAGWRAVEQLSAEYGIDDVNLVKPGVGETTRVLLRRVPWKVLIRADAVEALSHIRLLSEQRGVEVVVVEDLAYSCVGLIHPRFTRGAVGADGHVAATGAHVAGTDGHVTATGAHVTGTDGHVTGTDAQTTGAVAPGRPGRART